MTTFRSCFPRRQRSRSDPLLRFDLERLQLGLTAGVAATCFVSIFAAQLLLALACAVYVVRLAKRQAPLPRLPTDAPLLAFVVWTLLSASFSTDPVVAHERAKKLVLFAVLPLAVDSASGAGKRERVLWALLLGGIALTSVTLYQYAFLGFDTLDNRPRGFLGHYMTSSGLAMCLLVIAVARLLGTQGVAGVRGSELRPLALLALGLGAVVATQASERFALETERLFVAGLAVLAAGTAARAGGDFRGASRTFALVLLPLALASLLVSQTRGAWVGAVAGLGVLAALRASRALCLAGAAVAVALALLRPAVVVERLTLSDASSRDRYYMWQAGADMIRDKPVFGQGPGLIEARYPEYRWSQAPNPDTPHLHDNVLQIAAERGLPALAWWVWFLAILVRDAWRLARREPPGWEGTAALATLAALLVAGVFEYNFGDSEILMALLLVSALPYALRRERDPGTATAAGA